MTNDFFIFARLTISKFLIMDFLTSFFQNVKDKLTNPFFGTLAFVLVFEHWEFWYAIFNFDEMITLRQKLPYLRKVAEREFTFGNIVCNIFFAMLITTIGYGIIIGTRTLSLSIDYKIMPWITGRIIDKLVVLKTTHQEVVDERDEYSEKYEEQRKNVRGLSKDYDEQLAINRETSSQLRSALSDNNDYQSKITEITKDINHLKRENDTANADLHEFKKKYEDLKVLYDDISKEHAIAYLIEEGFFQLQQIFFDEQALEFFTSGDKFPPKIYNIVLRLIKDRNWADFLLVADCLKNGNKGIGVDTLDKILSYKVLIGTPGEIRLSAIGQIVSHYRDVFEKLDNKIPPPVGIDI